MLRDFFDDSFDYDDHEFDEGKLDFEVGDFFLGNLMKTRKAVTPESFKRFAALGSNGARVDFVLGYEEAHELSVEVDNYEKKDSQRANIIKKSGNKAFGLGHYEVAVDEYNNAILVAPKDELGVILGNRSAALYHLDKFDLALRDCDEAIDVGYPKHLRYKLEERRARCFLGLKRHASAMRAFKSALGYLDDAQVPQDKKTKQEVDMRIMLEVMEKGQRELTKLRPGLAGDNDEPTTGTQAKSLLNGMDEAARMKEQRNDLYPYCSAAVDIRDSGDDAGRHAIATRDIEPGEVLAIERPHCSSLLGEYRLTHCHGCLTRIVTPFPAGCYACSSVAYCSPKCRDIDKPVHDVECKILGPLWCSHASVTCILAIRAVIQKPFEQFVKIYTDLEADPHCHKISKAEPYVSKDYKAFYNLVTHEEQRTTEDLFHRAYMAAWLLRVLKTSSYFPDTESAASSANIKLSIGELAVGGAILHHLQLLQFNSHEISEFVQYKGTTDLSKGRSLFIGGGVYPTVALFNHSCNPGVVRYFIGNTIIVRAVKSIPAGGEVSENYGPIFTEIDEDERKRALRLQYWFDCNCEACQGHWPLLSNIDPNILRFKCESGPSCGNILLVNVDSSAFMISCSKCQKSTNIFKGLKTLQDTDSLYKVASENIKHGNHKNALKHFLKILKILDETLALPIKDYHLCQQGIRQCVLALGNFSKIDKH